MAIECWRKAAEQGFNGLGVAQDNAQAAFWYRKVAEQGDTEAIFGLGDLYANSHRNDITKDSACAVSFGTENAEVIIARMRDKIAKQEET